MILESCYTFPLYNVSSISKCKDHHLSSVLVGIIRVTVLWKMNNAQLQVVPVLRKTTERHEDNQDSHNYHRDQTVKRIHF
jgi:hypothetical protein